MLPIKCYPTALPRPFIPSAAVEEKAEKRLFFGHFISFDSGRGAAGGGGREEIWQGGSEATGRRGDRSISIKIFLK